MKPCDSTILSFYAFGAMWVNYTANRCRGRRTGLEKPRAYGDMAESQPVGKILELVTVFARLCVLGSEPSATIQ